jgi:hypothetical protein
MNREVLFFKLGEDYMESGLMVFNWTFVFQLLNIILWGLILFLAYHFFKKRKLRSKSIEKLEKDVEELKMEVLNLKKQAK